MTDYYDQALEVAKEPIWMSTDFPHLEGDRGLESEVCILMNVWFLRKVPEMKHLRVLYASGDQNVSL